MLSNIRYIGENDSVSLPGIDVDDTYIYSVGSSRYRKYNKDTLEQVTSDVSVVSGAVGISLLNSATAVIVSSSTNRIDFVDVTSDTLIYSATTGVDAVHTSLYGSQIATNPLLQTALVTTNSDGTLTRVASSGVCTTLSPSSLSGDQASCVIAKESTGGWTSKWLIGTDSGKVHQVDINGNVEKTINIPKTPNDGTAPSFISVTGLAFWEPHLLVATNFGMLYLFDFDSGQMKSAHPIAASTGYNPVNGCVIGSASGMAYLGPVVPGSAGSMSEIEFQASGLSFNAYNQFPGLSESVFSIVAKSDKVYFTIASTSFAKIAVLDASNSITGVETEMHIPEGVQVSGRIVRIKDDGPGSATIILDDGASAGATSLTCRQDSRYIELAINADDNKWDIREFFA